MNVDSPFSQILSNSVNMSSPATLHCRNLSYLVAPSRHGRWPLLCSLEARPLACCRKRPWAMSSGWSSACGCPTRFSEAMSKNWTAGRRRGR